LITIGIGYADRFEQFACAGQIIVTDVLRKKEKRREILGVSEYDRDGILRCLILFRN
jgi:hypothetical protein